ncbi:MAG: deiodinase-like protein, partial [Verrucomicrobiota bacterium]
WDMDQQRASSISEIWDDKPAVIGFGSITCDSTEHHFIYFKELMEQYSDQFDFAFVYIREAHAADAWDSSSIGKKSRTVDAKTDQIRRNVCDRFQTKVNSQSRMFVDSVDDRAAVAYAAWPSRYYVISPKGEVLYHGGGPGPWGVRLKEHGSYINFSSEPELEKLFGESIRSAGTLETFLKRYLKELETR